MRNQVIKPIATALWLLKNTKLTFGQIASFCSISEVEVTAMADGFEKAYLEPNNPIKLGQLTIEEIKKCEQNPNAPLKLSGLPVFNDIDIKVSKKVYTPISKRKDKINTALYLVEHYPGLTVAQIVKLTGSTKKAVESIKDKTYNNLEDYTAKDPVSLGVCSQLQLNEEIAKIKKEPETKKKQEEDDRD